jgi:hypothetical protein
MSRLILLFSAAVFCAFAQNYKLETIATPAPDLPAAYASVINSQGYRVNGPNGAWVEIWFRKTIPTGAKPSDPAITLPLTQGELIGVLRFPAAGYDRRGQTIKPGVYTLRYSLQPVDGAHQGSSPQRDFALMTPIALDSDPNAMPAFDALIEQSKKASNSPHPAVLSLETPSGSIFPALTKEGDNDWVLNVQVGDLQLALIVAGKAQA